MIIEAIYIENFRCIKQSQLNCDELTVIIGRNGSGKSSFLKAIEIFYDVNASISVEDFFNKDTRQEIILRVTYAQLKEDEIKEFQTYIRENKLIVTKRISESDGKFIQKYYAAAMQIPEFAVVRTTTSKTDKKNKLSELIASGKFTGLSGNIKSADAADELMTSYEAAHSELKQPIEKEEQFFGPKNIGGGKLDKYTKFVLVPAVREVGDEASDKKGTSLYQLLDLIVYRQVRAREDIRKFKEKFETELKSLYNSDNLKELPRLSESITETLTKFSPGAKLNLNWEEIKPPELPLPKAIPTLVDDDFEGDISRKGHGLQRALIITLLQQLALTAPYDNSSEAYSSESAETKDIDVIEPDLILAIEEPELYLHPLRCRYLSRLLSELSIKEDRTGRNQILCATHSPFFIDLYKFDQIRFICKQKKPEDISANSIVTQYSLEQAAKDLEKITEPGERVFTKESFRAHALPLMDTIANEGFFADAVVIVEGFGDMGVLWAMQDILKMDWPSLGIAIIPARGKNNIDRPVVIFRGFQIPTYFIFDADSRYKGKKEEQETINRNKKYLKLAGAKEEEFPSTQVHETWSCFEDEIESYLKSELEETVFTPIREETARELGYDKPSNVLKNLDGSEKFIQKVYSLGKALPVLEDIITQITKLSRR
ncbi:MAG: ATP-dependent endonuclease [Nitrospirae bacterium]|nr:ATP-dependent endonuclease [Nitrospirota bacterium]